MSILHPCPTKASTGPSQPSSPLSRCLRRPACKQPQILHQAMKWTALVTATLKRRDQLSRNYATRRYEIVYSRHRQSVCNGNKPTQQSISSKRARANDVKAISHYKAACLASLNNHSLHFPRTKNFQYHISAETSR